MTNTMSVALAVGAAVTAVVALMFGAEWWGERGMGDLRRFATAQGLAVINDTRVAEFAASGTVRGRAVAVEMLRPRTGRRTVTERTRIRVASASAREPLLLRARQDGAFAVALDPTRVTSGTPIATGDVAFDARFLAHAGRAAAPAWLDATTRAALLEEPELREVQALGTEVTVILAGHVTDPATLARALALATRLGD